MRDRGQDRIMIRPFSAAAALLAMAAATSASAQGVNASYPKSRALPDVAAWIASDTPLQLSQVVDVGPAAITAVTSAAPTGDPRGFLANIASEAVDPAIGRQEEILSWKIPVEIDCDRRAVRLGDMTGFRSRDLKTGARVVRQGDADWVQPAGSAPLGAVLRAMCDRDFKRPFASSVSVAAGAPEKTRPEPPPGPPPQVVALKPPTKPQVLTAAANPPPPVEVKASKPAPAETRFAAETKTLADPKPAARPKPASVALAHGASPYAVQVGATPSQDDAKGLMAHVQKKFPGDVAGFKTDVVAASVDGKTVYRVLITGFGGAKDASGLCDRLKAGGQACFVRK
jgi:hypothetical protein